MIEKIKGCPRIDKLRVIHLYEADYNLILKIIWARRLVWNLHKDDNLHDGQSGSRPGKRAIDVVVQKEMKYLYAHTTRTQLGTVDNDAKSCYDRIICNLAMAVSGYYGVPTCYRNMLSNNLEYSKYHLRGTNGDSKEFYKHSKKFPVHGTGQGSCASSPIWLIISSLLMNILDKHSYGMSMTDVMNTYKVIQAIEGFVDDTSLFCNTDFKISNILELIKRMCHDSSYWSGLLGATGGKLELTKCFYYLLTWKWDKKGFALPQTIQEQLVCNSNVTITNINGDKTNLQQRDISEAHKTLGTFKNIAGDESTHFKYLLHKSNKFSIDICGSQFNRRQTKTAYNMYYIPSISYSLASMCLNENQLETIQKNAVGSFLQKLGYEKHFPRAAVYGPEEFGGIGMKQLYSHSVCQKIDTLMGHINAKTSLGKLIHLVLGWIQIHCGISTPYLQSSINLSYLFQNWFSTIHEFMTDINGTIQIKNLWVPEKQRNGDKVIMDELMKLHLTIPQQKIFNNWRLFFQVNTIADMTTTDGKYIYERYLEKKNLPNFKSSSKINWPKQQQPENVYYTIWTTTIRLIAECSNKGKMKNPLGAWISNPHKYIVHNHIINPNHNEIRIRTMRGNVWDIYHHNNNSRGNSSFIYSYTKLWNEKNIKNYLPCNIKNQSENTIIVSMRDIKTRENTRVPRDTLTDDQTLIEFINNGQKLYKSLINKTQEVNGMFEILTKHNEYKICSDGGVRNNEAGIGVVTQINGIVVLNNKVRIATTFNDINSYRTEAYGILTALATYRDIKHYFTKLKCTDDTLEILCDNKAIVDKINQFRRVHTKTTTKFNYPDSDIVYAIVTMLRITRKQYGQITIKHVKGHQDRNTTNLSNSATLNIQADALATASLLIKNIPIIVHPTTQSTIYVNGKQITAKRSYMLTRTYQSIKLHKYYQMSNGWSDNTLQDIWWAVHSKALNKFCSNNKVTLKKFIFKWLPSNVKENRYYPYKSPYCTTCKSEKETSYHILQCRCCHLRQIERDDYLVKLQYNMEEMRTDKAVIRVIIECIIAWLNDRPPPLLKNLVDDPSITLKKALEAQNKIGCSSSYESWSETHDTRRMGNENNRINLPICFKCMDN